MTISHRQDYIQTSHSWASVCSPAQWMEASLPGVILRGKSLGTSIPTLPCTNKHSPGEVYKSSSRERGRKNMNTFKTHISQLHTHIYLEAPKWESPSLAPFSQSSLHRLYSKSWEWGGENRNPVYLSNTNISGLRVQTTWAGHGI